MELDYSAIGRRIQAARKARNMTQEVPPYPLAFNKISRQKPEPRPLAVIFSIFTRSYIILSGTASNRDSFQFLTG